MTCYPNTIDAAGESARRSWVFWGFEGPNFSEISIDVEWRFSRESGIWTPDLPVLPSAGLGNPTVTAAQAEVFGRFRRKIIYEVWGAVLVALHKPPETAPFFYFQAGTLGEALWPLVLEGMQKQHRKSIRGVHKN